MTPSFSRVEPGATALQVLRMLVEARDLPDPGPAIAAVLDHPTTVRLCNPQADRGYIRMRDLWVGPFERTRSMPAGNWVARDTLMPDLEIHLRSEAPWIEESAHALLLRGLAPQPTPLQCLREAREAHARGESVSGLLAGAAVQAMVEPQYLDLSGTNAPYPPELRRVRITACNLVTLLRVDGSTHSVRMADADLIGRNIDDVIVMAMAEPNVEGLGDVARLDTLELTMGDRSLRMLPVLLPDESPPLSESPDPDAVVATLFLTPEERADPGIRAFVADVLERGEAIPADPLINERHGGHCCEAIVWQMRRMGVTGLVPWLRLDARHARRAREFMALHATEVVTDTREWYRMKGNCLVPCQRPGPRGSPVAHAAAAPESGWRAAEVRLIDRQGVEHQVFMRRTGDAVLWEACASGEPSPATNGFENLSSLCRARGLEDVRNEFIDPDLAKRGPI